MFASHSLCLCASVVIIRLVRLKQSNEGDRAMRVFASLLISVLLAGATSAQVSKEPPKQDKDGKDAKPAAPAKPEGAKEEKAGVTAEAAKSPLDFTMKDIDG